MPLQTRQQLVARIGADADQCVKCGLCLPHCPTYAVDGSEAESPRGRIALLQRLADGDRQPDDSVTRHLDQCLSCRACERVCPAHVPYGRLFDAGQALLAEHAPARGRRRRRSAWLLHRPVLRRVLLRALFVAQRAGITRVLDGLLAGTRPGRWLHALPRLPWPREARDRAITTESVDVALFAGCLGDSVDRPALNALRGVLETAGYRCAVPRGQTCCGALEQHGGAADAAARAITVNANAMAAAAPAHIVGIASGCTAWLQDAEQEDPARPFAGRLSAPWPLLLERAAALPFRSFPERIAVWLPCTQRNVVRDEAGMLRVLRSVPGATIDVLPSPDGCCGASGLHFLEAPERADRLVAPIVAAIRDRAPGRVLCANVGCRLHLGAALRATGAEVPVVHPAEWLASRLGMR